MKVNFRKLVTRLSDLDNPIGDFCNDLLIDRDFNWRWGLAKKREYIFELPSIHGSHLNDATELFLEIFDELYKDELPKELENFREYLKSEDKDCEFDEDEFDEEDWEESHEIFIALIKKEIGFDNIIAHFTNEAKK